MKKNTLFRASLCVCVCCLFICRASAQTPVAPSNPDIFWYSPCGTDAYNAGFNTAMIDFNNGAANGSTLMVSAYYGNDTRGGLVCTDLASGFTARFDYCGWTNYIEQEPDIIVGNDYQNPGTDFRVAVAYPSQIDFFLVHYLPGFGSFTLTYISTLAIPTASSTVVHIDVIAEAANTSITGYPFCDKYVVVWDGPGGTINAAYGSLNAPGSFIQVMNSVKSGAEPDVAAIQRLPCGTCAPPPVNLALIAFIEPGGGALDYFEWDVSGVTPGGITSYSGYTGLYMPRIDAPDDYTINYPSVSSPFSYYKVVAQGNGTDVITFDNTSFVWDMSTSSTIPGYNYLPTVAYGGDNGTQYQVAQYNYPTTGPLPIEAYMEPIDWTVSGALAPPGDFYQVNYSPIAVLGIGFIHLTSVSTPCNNPADLTLVAWSYTPGTSLLSNIYYKVTPYAYAFRKPHVAPAATSEAWQVYPNPASGSLTVSSPIGSYVVTDMLGRTLLKGALTAGEQTIDITSLTPGSYIFTGYTGDTRNYHSVFVKQ